MRGTVKDFTVSLQGSEAVNEKKLLETFRKLWKALETLVGLKVFPLPFMLQGVARPVDTKYFGSAENLTVSLPISLPKGEGVVGFGWIWLDLLGLGRTGKTSRTGGTLLREPLSPRALFRSGTRDGGQVGGSQEWLKTLPFLYRLSVWA
jgi:hypothetical protein